MRFHLFAAAFLCYAEKLRRTVAIALFFLILKYLRD